MTSETVDDLVALIENLDRLDVRRIVSLTSGVTEPQLG
jgi:hypothetical protein